MALTNLNVVWFGPALAQGQVQSQGGISGTQSRVMIGIVTVTGDGAATTGTINWIDGVQKPFQTIQVLPVSSVTAPATIGGVANQAVYTGVGAYGQFKVGQSVTFAGFTNAGNNGAFTINALTTSTIQVTNAGSVAESNPAATVSFNIATGTLVASAQASRAIVSAAGVADTAAATITSSISTLTQTGALLTLSAAPANGTFCSTLIELFPAQ